MTERGADGKFVSTKVEEPKAPEPPKQVSKAPAPSPPVEPSAKTTVDWRNADSEEQFQEGWEAMMERRSKTRRLR